MVPPPKNSIELDINSIFSQIFPSVPERKAKEGVNYKFLELGVGVVLKECGF